MGTIFQQTVRVMALAACALGALPLASQAGVVASGNGYTVSYGIDMNPGTSSGFDVQHVFVFESDGTHFSVDSGFTIDGRGVTTLSHSSSFAPTTSLILGVAQGAPGAGDGLDHIYLVDNSAFANAAVGHPWNQTFPGSNGVRMRHSVFVNLVAAADAGDSSALDAVVNFARTDAVGAWFDTSGGFSVTEFSTPLPPVGGNVPEPGSAALALTALAGLGALRRQRRG